MDRPAPRRTMILVLAAILLSILPAGLTGPAAADNRILLTIATGSVTGTYYPIGKLIARIISQPPGSRTCEDSGNCGVPNLVATALSSAGSIANIRAIQSGQVPTGFAQADVAYAAIHGTGVFADGPVFNKLRVLANLYPENLHVVVHRESGIKQLEDLRDRRVSMDVAGSGTRLAAGIVLDAYGMSEKDIIVADTTLERASTLMRRGSLDAFFIVAGTPALAVESLTRDGIATVLPLDQEQIEAIVAEHRFFSPSTINAGIYNGVETAPAIAVGAQWLVSSKVPKDLVNAICRALWTENARKTLDGGHPKGRHITIDTALAGIAIPLHPGAERCYWDLALQPRKRDGK